jgi:hypothetical protein
MFNLDFNTQVQIARLYAPIFYNVMLVLVLVQCSQLSHSYGSTILARRTPSSFATFIFPLILIFFFGMRSIEATHMYGMFGDTGTYAYKYLMSENSLKSVVIDTKSEWLWNALMNGCRLLGFSPNAFFTVVAAGYIGFMCLACRRLTPNNVWIALLFFMSSYLFYSNGVNGIRNALASSLVLYAFSFFVDEKNSQGKWVALIVAFLALGIHRSEYLPVLCCIIAAFVFKDTKKLIVFWCGAIFLSLIAGNQISNFFAGLGFDDRMSNYLMDKSADTMNKFSQTGFRWDFLLYSAMPIWLGYYIIIKRGINDKTFSLLLNTYILSNAFWVMVIRASYSNRFANLSWFLYPIVLAYPLLKMKIWRDQDRKTAYFLLAQEVFTYVMWLIGK